MADDINTTLEAIVTSSDGLSTSIDDGTLALQSLQLALTTLIESCCKAQAGTQEGADSPPETGQVETGEPGAQFGNTAEYLDAKCKSANGIFDTIRNVYQTFDEENVDAIVEGGGSVIGILFALLALIGPGGWAIIGVAGAIAGMATALLGGSLDFEDLVTALDDVKDEIIQAMYDASSPEAARQGFLTEYALASPTPTSTELAFTKTILTNMLLNNLFDVGNQFLQYTPPAPYVCASNIWVIQRGTPTTDLTLPYVTLDSVYSRISGFNPYRDMVRVNIPSGVGTVIVDLTSMTTWTPNPYGGPVLHQCGYIDDAMVWTPSDLAPLTFLDNVCVGTGGFLDISAGAPFTATFTRGASCP